MRRFERANEPSGGGLANSHSTPLWSEPPPTIEFENLELTVLSGHVDIEVEAVLALVLDVTRRHVQVVCEPHRQHDLGEHAVDVLGADGRELRGVADLLPGSRSLGWLEAAVADGRRGVGHAQVLLDGAEDLIVEVLLNAAEFAVVGGDYGVFGRVYLLAGGQAEEQDDAEHAH